LTAQIASPARLAWQLAVYFAVLIGLMIMIVQIRPDVLQYLPIGGTNALSGLDATEMREIFSTASPDQGSNQDASLFEAGVANNVSRIILFLIGHLSGTIVLRQPYCLFRIAWRLPSVLQRWLLPCDSASPLTRLWTAFSYSQRSVWDLPPESDTWGSPPSWERFSVSVT